VDFYASRLTRDGLTSDCKECNVARIGAWLKTPAGRECQRRNNKKQRTKPKVKQQIREAGARYRKTAKGKASSIARQARYEASGKRIESLHRWYSKPEVRARLREKCRRRDALRLKAWVEKVEPMVVWQRALAACWICHEPVTLAAMEMDHVIPLSRGGAHSYANCKAACRACNRRKRDRLPSEIGISA